LLLVRRVARSRLPTQFPSLRLALNETKGTIEIVDEGPFAISDFRVPGESRLIRARTGFRPIIRIDRPNLAAVWSLPGLIVLEGKNLILDSLDLIVNIRDLNAAQTSLFCCTGANLTVRNCTITMINPANQSFSLVRAEGTASKGSRIRFEKTLIRGAVTSGFDLGKGSVDVAIRETVFLGSQGPLVRCIEPENRGGQRFSVVGGVLASRGPAFDLKLTAGNEAQRKQTPLVVRAFDTVFGRLQGAGIASIIYAEDNTASPRDLVNWLGQQNLFCGWKGYYASGAEQSLRVPSLAALRSTWNGTDESSREILAVWPQPNNLGQAVPDDLRPFVPGREAALSQAATPRPFLGAKTLWAFSTPVVPAPVELTAAAARASSAPAEPKSVFRTLDRKSLRAPINLRNAAVHQSAELLDIVFETDWAPWHGDLGAFLHDKLTEEVKQCRVTVRGKGPSRSSPVKLRDGLVLEIRAEPPVNRDAEWPYWQPQAESRARALFDLHGGTLRLSQLRLRADQSASVDSLINVEDGNLVLDRCQLSATAGAETRTPRLVTFSAASTRSPSSSPHRGLFTPEPDRPVCLILASTLISGASAVQATLGRGLVALSQSALAAGTDAIEMLPAPVARGRFEADLVLDHCTLTSQTNIIRLGAWTGREPGPDRPWLITSSNCAYLGSYERRVPETVLLRVDEEAMARGMVFWQGSGDAVDVDAFTAALDETLPGRSRDVGLQWTNFWGGSHQSEITGPRLGSNSPSVRFLERLKPGRIEPADLILDPNYHLYRPQLDVGADLSLQGISRRSAAPGRRAITRIDRLELPRQP
jgi:serine/threonine-protein kinase